MDRSESVRVMVVQGRCLLRDSLIGRMKRRSWIEVCATAFGLAEARELIVLYSPHVMVINASLQSGAEAGFLAQLRHEFPAVPVVTFSCAATNSFDDLIREIRSASKSFRVARWWMRIHGSGASPAILNRPTRKPRSSNSVRSLRNLAASCASRSVPARSQERETPGLRSWTTLERFCTRRRRCDRWEISFAGTRDSLCACTRFSSSHVQAAILRSMRSE